MIYYSKYEPIFGTWHITDELGTGAEGHLYRISRTDALGHVFYSALKAVSIPAGGAAELDSLIAGGMSREEAIGYFDGILEDTAQEFELLEKLKGNSNIVSYEDHDAFRREDGIGWDVLIRLEELTPLVSHAKDNPLNEQEVIRMGMDISRALVLCRKYGIVHRDIKPENIFISPAGSYKLGDFGIARIIEGTSASMSRKGTYSYMAPEVYWGKRYDHTVDIYSLGMVMYRYMNDGRMPLMPVYPQPVGYRDGEEAFAKRVCGEELQPPRNGSEGLKAIIMRACAFDAADRYRDAEDMLKDLERVSRGETDLSGLTAAGAGMKNKAAKGKKHRIAAIAAALVLIAAGVAYALIPKEVTDIEAGSIEGGAEIYIGEEMSAEFKVVPDWFKDEPVTVTSSDPSIVSVEAGDSLKANAVGEAVVSITAKEYTEEALIKVVPKVTAIEGIEDTISLTTGETLTVEPVLKPEEFADEPVTFTTADPSVAEVKSDGSLKAVSAGETKLTVSAGGSSFESDITVTDPVIYVPKKSGSSKSSSGTSQSGSSKSGSGKASKGYFDTGDDEEF